MIANLIKLANIFFIYLWIKAFLCCLEKVLALVVKQQ